jgi:monothiol glutaredoxin
VGAQEWRGQGNRRIGKSHVHPHEGVVALARACARRRKQRIDRQLDEVVGEALEQATGRSSSMSASSRSRHARLPNASEVQKFAFGTMAAGLVPMMFLSYAAVMPEISNPRPILSDELKTEQVRAKIAGFHGAVVEEVRSTVARDGVVVVGMATNVFVKRVRKTLTEQGIAFTYLEYGGYMSRWGERLAIKLWSGWPTFPQVYVRGHLIGGNDDTQKALANGELRRLLEG